MKPSTITDVQVHRDELKFEENRRRKLSRLKKKIIDTLLKSAVLLWSSYHHLNKLEYFNICDAEE